MPSVFPFRAVEYAHDAADATDLSTRLAPPYDVLSERDVVAAPR